MKWLLVLTLLPVAAAAPLDDAVDWMATQPVSRISAEAAGAAGYDLQAWPDIPAWGKFPVTPGSVRSLHAAALTGYNPASVQGLSGDINVVAALADSLDATLAEGRAATMAFHVLAMHAAGMPIADMASLADAMERLEQGGQFPCNQTDLNPDCTGFVATALVVAGRTGACDDVSNYWAQRLQDGAYGDNTNTHAWAIISLQACGQAAPASANAWLLAQQQSDGSFGYRPDAPGPAATRLIATADAVLALADFPGPRYQDLALEWEGPRLRATGDFDLFTWHDGSTGPTYEPQPGELVRVHAVGGGVHARAAMQVPGPASNGAPMPWFLPVLALGAMLWRRAPLDPR